MRLTQDEARKWAKILQGFADGKRYKIPFLYKEVEKGKYVVEKYEYITDFDVNPNTPTIILTYPNTSQIDVDLVSED